MSLLPSAFLVCTVQLQANLVHGFPREDGSQEHLSLDDIGRCLEAKDDLREASVTAQFRVLAPTVAPTCKSPSQCAKVLKNTFRGNGMEERIRLMMAGDVLLDTLRYFEIEDGKYTLCPACVDMVKEREREENVAMWKSLPELLGIDVPGWKDAVAASAAAK